MCVYLLSFFVSLPSFFSLFFFFFWCIPLFIERLQRSCSLIFLSTDQIMEQFSSVFFSSTIPNFMLSRDPLFSFWLFYLFRCFLSSFFLVCDSPTFRLLRPNFMKPCSFLSGDATSLFTFQLFYFILLDLFLSIS